MSLTTSPTGGFLRVYVNFQNGNELVCHSFMQLGYALLYSFQFLKFYSAKTSHEKFEVAAGRNVSI